jgi:hypothetical protein
MIEFQTASGSTYLVDELNLLVRRVVRSSGSASERMQPAWKPYVTLGAPVTIGKPVVIIWGYGRDERSEFVEAAGDLVGARPGDVVPDESRTRMTMTSPVTTFRRVDLDA